MLNRFVVVLVCLITLFAFNGCTKKKSGGSSETAESAPVEGVEKVKPAPGTGNVQGKVLYNGALAGPWFLSPVCHKTSQEGTAKGAR